MGKEVQELLARAKAIRDSLPQDEGNTGVATSATSTDETQQQQQYPSSKEGVVTVRQMGWHTGWRRDESRIVGTFRAVPIDKAKQKDGF